MKTLVLGSIPDDFGPDTHIPLAPWCFSGKEDVFPGWENLPFEPDPFKSAEELAAAAQLTASYANSLIPELSRVMNEMHGTNYSPKFWRVLLMPWLLYLVQTTWERQCRILNFVQKHGNHPFKVRLSRRTQPWDFVDTADFLYSGVLNPGYNEWLISLVLERCLPKCWHKVTVDSPVVAASGTSQSGGLRKWVRKRVFLRLRCIDVPGIGHFGSLFWSWLLALKPPCSAISKGLDEESERTSQVEWALDFWQVIWQTLPICFKQAFNVRPEKRRAKRAKLNVVGPVLFYDETAKLELAQRVEGGERVIAVQHGGNYGTLKSVPVISEMEYKQDGFFTWGWNGQEDYQGNFYALPSPYLRGFQNRHCRRNNQVILVGTVMIPFSYRLDSVPQPSEWVAYRKGKREFIQYLPQPIRENLVYRPYFDERGALRDREYILRRFPDLKILEGDLEDHILKCRLVVLDHPVTTLNIAMAANVPLICFWDPQAWHFCRQAEPFFAKLREVGVLFDSALEASQQVAAIWDEMERWWMTPRVQDARLKWCEHYACVSSRWWWKWLRQLWRS